MINLDKFRQNAAKESLCSEYTGLWDGCKSNKDFIDLAISSKGADYLCDAIAKGWGISPEEIAERFKYFTNGKYVRSKDGYSSELYCIAKQKITAKNTIYVSVDSVLDIEVPEFHICTIYATGKSELNMSGKGDAILVIYGDKVKVNGKCDRMKVINKKNRDEY